NVPVPVCGYRPRYPAWSRRMDRLKVVIYPMADRSLVTYFPESNHMLTLDNHDPLSGIPGYKSIPVELEPSN
ncbi:hypothetical protein ACUOCP_53445, partial [Escherichia sp. R-CC3]